MFVETIRQPGQSKIESNKALIERTERKRERERRPSIGENIKHFELLQNIYKLLISNCPSKRKVPSTTGGLNAEPPYGFAPNRTKMKRNSEFRIRPSITLDSLILELKKVNYRNKEVRFDRRCILECRSVMLSGNSPNRRAWRKSR